MKTLTKLSCAVLVATLTMAAPSSDASADGRIDVVISDASLEDVLAELATALDLALEIGDGVEDSVSIRLADVTATEALDRLGARYGFDWIADDGALRVVSRSTYIKRLIDLGGATVDEIEATLRGLDSFDPRFEIKATDDQIALLTAPPEYIALVELVTERIAREANVRSERMSAEEAAALAMQEQYRAALEAYRERQRALDAQRPIVIRNGRVGG